MSDKVWFITGTSSGIGRAMAEEAVARGHCVVATARHPDSVADLVAAAPDKVAAIRLDVTKTDEVTAALDAAVARFGRIDVVVNNAGSGYMGALEELSEQHIRQGFETMVFAPIAVIKAALPRLRAQRSGLIINISSRSAMISPPCGSMYGACKAALEAMSETLAEEIRPFGIKVMIVQPGQTHTDFFGSITFAEPMEAYENTAVAETRALIASSDRPTASDPADVARAIVDAADSETAPLRLMLGAAASTFAELKISRLKTELEESNQYAFWNNSESA